MNFTLNIKYKGYILFNWRLKTKNCNIYYIINVYNLANGTFSYTNWKKIFWLVIHIILFLFSARWAIHFPKALVWHMWNPFYYHHRLIYSRWLHIRIPPILPNPLNQEYSCRSLASSEFFPKRYSSQKSIPLIKDSFCNGLPLEARFLH